MKVGDKLYCYNVPNYDFRLGKYYTIIQITKFHVRLTNDFDPWHDQFWLTNEKEGDCYKDYFYDTIGQRKIKLKKIKEKYES